MSRKLDGSVKEGLLHQGGRSRAMHAPNPHLPGAASPFLGVVARHSPSSSPLL
jgi:hypothetical protein